jgi:hypothetical protein
VTKECSIRRPPQKPWSITLTGALQHRRRGVGAFGISVVSSAKSMGRMEITWRLARPLNGFSSNLSQGKGRWLASRSGHDRPLYHPMATICHGSSTDISVTAPLNQALTSVTGGDFLGCPESTTGQCDRESNSLSCSYQQVGTTSTRNTLGIYGPIQCSRGKSSRKTPLKWTDPSQCGSGIMGANGSITP